MLSVFITSSPTGPLDGSRPVDGMDSMNGFREKLRERWKPYSRCLMITAFPDDIPASEEMTDFFRNAVERSGVTVSCFDLWDSRKTDSAVGQVEDYDVIFLGGGHVPTQNRFFEKLRLRKAMEGFEGIVVGISAGSMNSADWVYCQPEEAGEAVSPHFIRWIRGLNLTRTMILPHYQMVKDRWLDGMRLYDDITAADSQGNHFLLLNDGSYLLCEAGHETVYGEAYVMEDRICRQICRDGESIPWSGCGIE